MEGVEIRESLKKMVLICPTTRSVVENVESKSLNLRKVGLLRAFLHHSCQKCELGIQDIEKVHLLNKVENENGKRILSLKEFVM